MNKESMAKYVLIAVLLLVLILAAVFLAVRPSEADESSGMGLTVDPYSGTFTAPEKDDTEKESSGGIAVPGWGSIRIAAGEVLVDVNLQNPIDNADKYNMSFTLYLDGEEEALAQTGLIRPGESALKLELSHPLSEGEYDATVLVQPYRMADNSATNNAEIKTILIVK